MAHGLACPLYRTMVLPVHLWIAMTSTGISPVLHTICPSDLAGNLVAKSMTCLGQVKVSAAHCCARLPALHYKLMGRGEGDRAEGSLSLDVKQAGHKPGKECALCTARLGCSKSPDATQLFFTSAHLLTASGAKHGIRIFSAVQGQERRGQPSVP